jgi:hypothetical protein
MTIGLSIPSVISFSASFFLSSHSHLLHIVHSQLQHQHWPAFACVELHWRTFRPLLFFLLKVFPVAFVSISVSVNRLEVIEMFVRKPYCVITFLRVRVTNSAFSPSEARSSKIFLFILNPLSTSTWPCDRLNAILTTRARAGYFGSLVCL